MVNQQDWSHIVNCIVNHVVAEVIYCEVSTSVLVAHRKVQLPLKCGAIGYVAKVTDVTWDQTTIFKLIL